MDAPVINGSAHDLKSVLFDITQAIRSLVRHASRSRSDDADIIGLNTIRRGLGVGERVAFSRMVTRFPLAVDDIAAKVSQLAGLEVKIHAYNKLHSTRFVLVVCMETDSFIYKVMQPKNPQRVCVLFVTFDLMDYAQQQRVNIPPPIGLCIDDCMSRVVMSPDEATDLNTSITERFYVAGTWFRVMGVLS